jgi:4-hydroxybenzoate polyprenyltransferase
VWTGAGVATIVGASALGLVTVFVLWRRMPAAAAYVLMASCGVGVAVGGLLVQDDVGTASWVVAVVALGVVAPVHARLVFGPPGRAHVVAAGPAAA